MSKTQTVVLTPNVLLSSPNVLNYVRGLLPPDVTLHLDRSERVTNISEDNGSVIVQTTWADDDDVDEYKRLMAEVTPMVKSQLDDLSWTYVFTPETADL